MLKEIKSQNNVYLTTWFVRLICWLGRAFVLSENKKVLATLVKQWEWDELNNILYNGAKAWEIFKQTK